MVTVMSLLCLTAVRAWQNQKVNTQIFTGTMFHPLKLWAYESSIPITFKIPISFNLTNFTKYENDRPCKQNNRSTECRIETNLKFILGHINEQLLIEQAAWEVQKEAKRKTRGITVIGKFFKWCCDIATQNEVNGIVENEQYMTDNLNNMVDLSGQDHENIILTAKSFNNFSIKVHNISHKIQENILALEKQINNIRDNPELTNQMYITSQNTLKYLFLNFYYDNLRDLKTKCNEHKIPHTVVSKANLQAELEKLDATLAITNQKLAIDVKNELEIYYKLPLATCFFSKTNLIIKLQVPINKRSKLYMAYKNIPIPLFWKNQTCYVTKNDYTIITVDQLVYVIDKHELGCNENSYPLCLIPRQTITNNIDQKCIRQILLGAPVVGLKKSCEFICHNSTAEPILTKLLPNKYFITNNIQNLTVDCPQQNKSKVLPKNKAGTIELLIPCDCRLLSEDGQELLTTLHPCDEEDEKHPTITHLIPCLWMKIQTIQFDPLQDQKRHAFTDESEILNTDWDLEISTVKIQDRVKVQKEHLKLKHSAEDIFNNNDLLLYGMGIWLSLVTILIAIGFYCILINNAKLTMLAPAVPPRQK